MSRKLVVVFLTMLVLVGAMGLKTAVVAHSDGSLIMAQGGAPQPPIPWKQVERPSHDTLEAGWSAPTADTLEVNR